MPKFLTFACRGFSLLVPMTVFLAYYLYVVHVREPEKQQEMENASAAECLDKRGAIARDKIAAKDIDDASKEPECTAHENPGSAHKY